MEKAAPGGLNFGDCFVYALAKSSGELVLAKGTGFGQTDIAVYKRGGRGPFTHNGN